MNEINFTEQKLKGFIMEINKNLRNNKETVIDYFRNRALEFIEEVNRDYGKTENNKKASKCNTKLVRSKDKLIQIIIQKATKNKWDNITLLESILTVTYASYVVMLETRHSLRPYEYMDFSRRVGEIWEPFCKLCFHYPINDIELFVPPLFSEVKKMLYSEIKDYIANLNLTDAEKDGLLKYYGKVWNLVTSGEIQLELDLHFVYEGRKYVVDFKSGFGSNEKGNVNRLLLVASIYHTIEDNYHPLLFVRSTDNNNYFDTLKKSEVWQAYCGNETYEQIKTYSGYDLKKWINDNIDWENDLIKDFTDYLLNKKLLKYLVW